MDLRLNGHHVLITGGASGIGLASARAFAEEGCSVVLWDTAPSVQNIAAELAREKSISITGQQVDVSDETSIQTALQELAQHALLPNHVVHCAAIGSGKFGFPFTQLTPTDWKRTLDINILGMVNLAHAVTPYLIERGAGTYVFLASVAGQIGSQTDPPYSASKAANINFAQCMAKDLAPHGIRVNTVCPGMVRTSLNQSVWQAWHDQTPEGQQLGYDEWADRKIKSIVPLGTWQTAEDIADMIVFLSSDRARQITG
ncbi:MAG: SDR family oxidoreductase, partial [Planctomycetaceae bacterium]|nr:SDR family oxidoreductase [Planctomycetaceae bacterium]